MIALSLDVRIDGFADPIGTLMRNENAGVSFIYKDAFLSDENATPVSLSMPLRIEAYGDVIARAFFDNLLQERSELLESIRVREGIERDDIVGLLVHLGKDCAGAVSVLPQGSPPTKVPGHFSNDYEIISFERVAEIVNSLHVNNVFPKEMQDPSPLAGVQNKFAVTVLPDGNFAFPKPGNGAPTTHIIKVPKHNHPNDAKQEAAALILSKAVGIETIDAEIRDFKGVEVLMVKRFDRALNAEGNVVRLHQEDFAQAMGLPRQLKYERDGIVGRSFNAKAVRRVLEYTVDPALSITTFIKTTFFDLLIGNVDAHAKNHALLYNYAGKPTLSPRYDLLPTRLDDQFTDELPYRIGNAGKLNELRLEDIHKFLVDLGLDSLRGRQRVIQSTINDQAQKLSEFFIPLQTQRLKLFADLIESNTRTLCNLVKVDIPHQAQNRDAFISYGGGWLLS
jgi:serine/threonine-protein kinase HipA